MIGNVNDVVDAMNKVHYYFNPPVSTSTPTYTPTSTTTSTPTATFTPTKIPTSTPVCTTRNQGDADCDTRIDLMDFEQFRVEYFSFRKGSLNIVTAKANFNFDNYIDLVDLEVFRQGYINYQKQ